MGPAQDPASTDRRPAGQSGPHQEDQRAPLLLYCAYLIKEQLHRAFAVRGKHGRALSAGVISWAARSRIPEMVKLAATLRTYQKSIKNTLDSGVTNGRVEATNTHIQTLIKQAYGYGSADALIAMIELKHGGLCPELPGR